MIEVCSNCHRARVFIVHTRPYEILPPVLEGVLDGSATENRQETWRLNRAREALRG